MTTKKVKKQLTLKVAVTPNEVAMLNFAITCAGRFFKANPDSVKEHGVDFLAFTTVADKVSDWIHINSLCKDPRCNFNGKHIARKEDAN